MVLTIITINNSYTILFLTPSQINKCNHLADTRGKRAAENNYELFKFGCPSMYFQLSGDIFQWRPLKLAILGPKSSLPTHIAKFWVSPHKNNYFQQHLNNKYIGNFIYCFRSLFWPNNGPSPAAHPRPPIGRLLNGPSPAAHPPPPKLLEPIVQVHKIKTHNFYEIKVDF